MAVHVFSVQCFSMVIVTWGYGEFPFCSVMKLCHVCIMVLYALLDAAYCPLYLSPSSSTSPILTISTLTSLIISPFCPASLSSGGLYG